VGAFREWAVGVDPIVASFGPEEMDDWIRPVPWTGTRMGSDILWTISYDGGKQCGKKTATAGANGGSME